MKGWRAWAVSCGVALVVITLAYQFSAPMQIAVGERSADPFIQGFYFREDAPFGAFRWSSGRADLFFRGIGNQDGTLEIQMGGTRGGVRLSANGEEIARDFVEGAEVKEYAFPIERARVGVSGDLVVTLASDTFTAPPDTRELGVQVLSATFEPRGGLVFPAPLTTIYILLDAVLVWLVARAWSGSTRIAWGLSALVVIASAAGLAYTRVESAWLVGICFWFGVIAYGAGRALAWGLQKFYPLDTRELRVLGLLLLAAFVVRLPFAVTPGYITDVQDYVVWSYKFARYGLASAYAAIEGLWIADYPPVLLYAFQAIGVLYQKFFAPDFLYPVTAGDPALRALTTNPALLADPIHRTLLRMPALLADLVTGSLVFALARGKISTRNSFLLAASYWFNPAVIYNSAWWGQTDAVHTLFVVLAFALVEVKRAGWGFLSLAIGGLTKPQAFVFGPLLLLRAFQNQKTRGVLFAGIGGALGVALALAPTVFAGALPGLVAHFLDTVGHHPILSANAHNLWWLVMRGNINVPDESILFAGLSYRAVGLILLAGAYGLALLLVILSGAKNLGSAVKRFFVAKNAPQNDMLGRDVWLAAAYVGFAFFILPTEIHENYGFAVLALLAVAIAFEKRWEVIALYAVLSVTMVVNYALYDPNVFALLGVSAPDAQLLNARWVNAAVNVVVFGAWTARVIADCRFQEEDVK